LGQQPKKKAARPAHETKGQYAATNYEVLIAQTGCGGATRSANFKPPRQSIEYLGARVMHADEPQPDSIE